MQVSWAYLASQALKRSLISSPWFAHHTESFFIGLNKLSGLVVIFLAGVEQRTIPLQMWGGIREQISPTILAVATILVAISIALLTVLELLRRRNELQRGIIAT